MLPRWTVSGRWLGLATLALLATHGCLVKFEDLPLGPPDASVSGGASGSGGVGGSGGGSGGASGSGGVSASGGVGGSGGVSASGGTSGTGASGGTSGTSGTGASGGTSGTSGTGASGGTSGASGSSGATGAPDPANVWTFDEGIGSTASDTVGAAHGTVVGAEWVAGKVGGALSFDGDAEDRVEIPGANLEAGLRGDKDFTIAFWVRLARDPATTPMSIIRYAVSGDDAWFGMDPHWSGASQPYDRWIVGNNTGGDYCHWYTAQSSPPGSWSHVVAVWRATPRTGEFWLDGVPLAVTVFCPNPQSNGPRLGLWSFGKIPTSGGQRLWGELDEMVIWHRALTSAEIASEHNGGSGVPH